VKAILVRRFRSCWGFAVMALHPSIFVDRPAVFGVPIRISAGLIEHPRDVPIERVHQRRKLPAPKVESIGHQQKTRHH
jgi:hypothetical protein